MNIGEHLKKLITTDNYVEERMKVTDGFIDMVRDMMPRDYEYIREDEESYQELIKMLKSSIK